MRSLLPSLVLLAVLGVALVRLPPLHPLQVWCASWALATMLYALKLLPYRDLAWLTVALIVGATAAFAVGVWAGQRLGRLMSGRSRASGRSQDAIAVGALAAKVMLGLGGLLFALYLAQLSARYGVLNTLRVSRAVRLSLVGGGAPASLAYTRVATAAAALCALVAAGSGQARTRRNWLLACSAAIGSLYFSTGRQLMLNALITAGVLYMIAGGAPLSGRQLIRAFVAFAAVALVVFTGVGAVIGNTYETNAESKFSNTFSRNPAISWLAPAYAHLSAPIPALDIAVKASTPWGRADGCAMAALECRMLAHMGLQVDREPTAAPFTRSPLPWNTYTFLGDPLIDGGRRLALLFVALAGALIGLVWSRSRSGPVHWKVAYAFAIPVMVWAYRQNLLDVMTSAALVAVAAMWLAASLLRMGRRSPLQLRRAASAKLSAR